MGVQNLFDNSAFFTGYQGIRDNPGNANVLVEKPALFSLLPDLNGSAVLDLGCGYGENSREFIALGAQSVLGVDISKKMLAVATQTIQHSRIRFLNMPMEAISELQDTFDVIVSSLAIHYIQDFGKLAKDVYNLLKTNGQFVFSQESPINTCFSDGCRWTRDENGNAVHANLYNYNVDGKRESEWFDTSVVKYHRKFSSIVNTLVNAGFTIQSMLEPLPDEEIMEKHPEYKKDIHKPDFLLVKAAKSGI